MDNKKSNFWKFAVAFVVIVVLALGVFVAARVYERFQADKKIQETIETLQKNAADAYARAMADTYGGKTPQETLQMYIDAVESGDYALASKYFIFEKQKQWKDNLVGISKINRINSFLAPMKQAQKSSGEYSVSGDTFSIHDPILVSFIKYPSGIWKITEI